MPLIIVYFFGYRRDEVVNCVSCYRGCPLTLRCHRCMEKINVERNLRHDYAIVRFWRNQESYQLNEDGVLLCDGKLVITQSEIKNVIRTEFDQSKGKGPRTLRFRLGEQYSGVSERRIQHVLDRSRRYQILKARFNNKVVLHPIRAKEVHTRHV